MTEKEHGGVRPGAGRKPIAEAAMGVMLAVRMSREQRDKVEVLGALKGVSAGHWIRAAIDRAKLPTNGGEK